MCVSMCVCKCECVFVCVCVCVQCQVFLFLQGVECVICGVFLNELRVCMCTTNVTKCFSTGTCRLDLMSQRVCVGVYASV